MSVKQTTYELTMNGMRGNRQLIVNRIFLSKISFNGNQFAVLIQIAPSKIGEDQDKMITITRKLY